MEITCHGSYHLQDAKHAYESVLVVSPRRPEDEEFLHFEREAMRIAASRYGYSYSSKYLV